MQFAHPPFTLSGCRNYRLLDSLEVRFQQKRFALCIVPCLSCRYRMQSPGTCYSHKLSWPHRSSRLEWSEWWTCPAKNKARITSISFFTRKQFPHRHVSFTWVIRWSSSDADTESVVETAREKGESKVQDSGFGKCLHVHYINHDHRSYSFCTAQLLEALLC